MEITNTESTINRELSRERAENESKRADVKQHADKLIQGFEKLEESHAKRAIWELFQNAIDLSDNCEVVIRLTENHIIFEHNGKPFTSNTLSCLIKQVSSKNSQNNEDEVGQYGTGFITTHSFGKKILISGSIKEGDYYIPIEDFEIDRVVETSDQLIDKIIIQQQRVFDLIGQGKLETDCSSFTKFAYETLSTIEKQNANKAVESLKIILPYVMMINNKLKQVQFYDKNNYLTTYIKGSSQIIDEVNVTDIHINQNTTKIFSLYSKEEDLTVILPLSESNKSIILDENLSKLFLYYPLIGSEKFGFNFVVHSKRFAPTEPRDGIHLKSKNEQVQEKELSNRELLNKASSMIFEFVEKNATNIEHPKNLGYINFNTGIPNIHLSEYFKELKENWVENFKNFQIVETQDAKLKPKEIHFLSNELLLDAEYYDSIYSITNLFWKNIPKKEIAKSWTENINYWEDTNTNFIKVDDIVKKIEEAKTLDFFPDQKELISFYQYLQKHQFGDLFNKHSLLPNIKNEFRLFSQLNSTHNIDDALIKVADVIIPEVPKRYIKAGFELNLVFEPYDRKQFSKDINSQIAEINKTLGEASLLKNEDLLALIDYCKIFPTDDSTSTRAKLIKSLCSYYDVDSTVVILPTIINQEIDWLQSMRCLLKNLIWELNSKDAEWIESNIPFLTNLLDIIHSYYEFDDIIQTLPIFPNQLFNLCKQSELKTDGSIDEELKDLYDRIVNPDKKIRSTLVLSGFSKYIKDNETKYSHSLGTSIEKVFEDAMQLSNINKHPYSKEILWIIKKISDDYKWSKYFLNIEDEKATIMMARISNAETKNDLFSIIGLEPKQIALLGELAKQVDLERIISLGKIALEEEKRDKQDFQFKHAIGTHIEKLVRDKIGADLNNFKITVRDEQGGQDIIVEYNNSIVYYIEVKSRWDIRSSISMSALQMKNSVINRDKYSLCCVEMSDYKVGDESRYEESDINEIKNRINVINDIGNRIKPLLDGVLSVKDIENEISLVGDYRGTIPQTIVKKGQSLDDFINFLIAKIKPN
jgi:hypothetical protein